MSSPEHIETLLTLPNLLRNQAAARPHKVALRHKRLGVWQSWTWRDLLAQTRQYAAALSHRQLGAETRLLLLSRPRVEALLLALAVQSLGGVVEPLDPELPTDELQALLADIRPTFVFAEGQSEVDLLIQSGVSVDLIIYADPRGLRSYKYTALLPLNQLLSEAVGTTLANSALDDTVALSIPHLSAHRSAFVFYGRDSDGFLIHQDYSHAYLIEHAKYLINKENLSATEDALAARAFATAGQARYLIAPWLVAGFRLNFPENLTTRDNDRREISPTLVLGTSATYTRVADLAAQKLPTAGGFTRRIYDWAIQPAPHRALAGVGAWLVTHYVRRVLREHLGFAKLSTALLIGEPLPLAYTQFYQSLGIQIRRLTSSGTQISRQNPEHLNEVGNPAKSQLNTSNDATDQTRTAPNNGILRI